MIFKFRHQVTKFLLEVEPIPILVEHRQKICFIYKNRNETSIETLFVTETSLTLAMTVKKVCFDYILVR